VLVAFPEGTTEDACRQLLASCNAVLGDNSCVPATESPSATTASSSAVPSSSPERSDADATRSTAELWWEGDALRIRYRPAQGATLPTYTRSLQFAPADPSLERWTAAGLVVAALAASASASQDRIEEREATAPLRPDNKPKDAPRADEAAEPRNSAERNERDEAPRPLSVDLGALLGPGLAPEHWRSGPLLRATYFAPMGFGITASVHDAHSAEAVTLQWLGVSLGPAWRPAQARRVGVDLHTEGVLEWVFADAARAGERDDATTLRWGGRAGANAWLALSPLLHLWLGVNGSALLPRLEVEVAGEAAGAEPLLQWTTAAGLGLQLEP
jgi:hypothetical protein